MFCYYLFLGLIRQSVLCNETNIQIYLPPIYTAHLHVYITNSKNLVSSNASHMRYHTVCLVLNSQPNPI